jgi:hypothetical protein
VGVRILGFSEKIEKAAVKKERKRGLEDINELFGFLKCIEVKDLNYVLSEIRNLTKSELYEKVIKAVTTKNKFDVDVDYMDKTLQNGVLKIAFDNLRKSNLLTVVFTGSLITINDFLTLYTFIESIYYMNLDRGTNFDDTLNVYLSGCDERIIFALDCFDEVELENIPKPTSEYFQMLKTVTWKDKKAKNVYNKLNELMMEVSKFVLDYPDLNQRMGWLSTYWSTQNLFIQLLAACSAANDNRLEIKAEDVIKAYKTFFKLIKTDVTKYKSIPELVQDIEGYNGSVMTRGYLVCKNCGGYYKLQAGESPEDFERCRCGGELEYSEGIDFEDH